MKIAVFALVALVSSPMAWADAKDYYYRRAVRQADQLRQSILFPEESTPLQATSEGTFDQRIDHEDTLDGRTFKQRYFINRAYATGANPPVLFYICGESICEPGNLGGATAAHAQRLGAVMITLEHRYYGKSVPFDRLTADNLKYLTIDAALQDLASFQGYATAALGLTGKWITIGGSYPGDLSAFYRQKYPRLTQGSLASSAPVLVRDNFEAYDLHVTLQAGPDCAAQMRKATAAVEEALADPARHDAIKALFDAEKVKNDDDFLYLIADVGAAAVQYGMKDRFCQVLSAPGDLLAAYSKFAKQLFAAWGMSAYQFSMASAESEDPNDYLTGFGTRSWLWQSCREFGGFQNAWHQAGVTTRSTRINPEYHRQLCGRLFGADYARAPDIEGTNHTYYEPLLKPGTASHILYTNGSQDPWSELGITPANGNVVNPATELAMIEGAAHCDDLRTPSSLDSAALARARARFAELTAEWLK